jgi:hypothetical protein
VQHLALLLLASLLLHVLSLLKGLHLSWAGLHPPLLVLQRLLQVLLHVMVALEPQQRLLHLQDLLSVC